jgi:hypothetical protein
MPLMFVILFSILNHAHANQKCKIAELMQATGVPFDRNELKIKTPRTEKATRELFDSIRENLVKTVDRSNLPEEDKKIIIRRFKLVNLEFADCPRGDSSPGSMKTINLTMSLCKQTSQAPLMALVALIGHELGHTVDMENLGCPLVQIKKNTNLVDHLPPTLIQDQQIKLHLDDIARRTDRLFNLCAVRQPERDSFAALVEKGVLTVVDNGVPPIRNPTRNTFICLNNHSSNVGLAKRGPPPDNQAAAEAERMSFGESSAQMWGALAVSNYVSAEKSLTNRDILEMSYYSQVYQPGSIKSNMGKERDLNEIYFSSAAIQDRLQCQPIEGQRCIQEMLPTVQQQNIIKDSSQRRNSAR